MLVIWLVEVIFLFAVQCFRIELEFGTWDQRRLRGGELSFAYNRKPVKISMSKFFKTWSPLLFPNMSKTTWMLHWKDMYTPNFVEVSVSFSGCNRKGNPLLSLATGTLQSKSATPNGHDLLSLKLMREATSMPDPC